MRGRGLFAVVAMTLTTVVCGCSKTEGTKPPRRNSPGDARAPLAPAGPVRM